MNWDALDFSILGPAMLAGFLVLSTHVPLGLQVLKRGIIFLDLAIAQLAGLGVVLAQRGHWENGAWQVQLIAILAAMSGAWLLYWLEKRLGKYLEAVIGCVFVLAACASLLAVSSDPHGGEQLTDILNGQILWVSYQQLWPVALIYGLVLLCWFFWQNRSPLLFYLLFALCITLSVQLVGVYLVFASLIIPALLSQCFQKYRLLLALIAGLIGYALGLFASAVFDWPTGATIVWALALVCLVWVGSFVLLQRK